MAPPATLTYKLNPSPETTNDMAEHNETGAQGEKIAAEYLVKNGYKILERNWRNYHQEIDIIASKGDELVIVEVKCRTGNPMIAPAAAVNRNKQSLLIKAANAYIREKNIDLDTRFDIISVILGNTIHVEHLEYAFYPMVGKR
jgi:putative endonuclease